MKAKTIYEVRGDVLKLKSLNDVNEANILRPKSEEEIRDITMSLMKDINFSLHDQIQYQNEDSKNLITKLAKLMDSDTKDIFIVSESEDNYETIEKLLRMVVTKKGKAQYIRFEDIEFIYVVSPHNKITFAVSMGLGLDAVFFNKTFVLELLKEYYG